MKRHLSCFAALSRVALVCSFWLSLAGLPLASRAQAIEAPQTLPELVRMAVTQDPQVRSARAQWEAAQALTAQARSRWWPSVGMSAQLGQADVTDLNREFERSTQRAEAFMRLNVFNGGADRALLRGTQHDESAARLDLVRTLQDVAERTAQAFFELMHRQALQQQAAARLGDVQQLSQDVQLLVSVGKSPESDAHVAQASVADAQSNHAATQVDAALALRRLQTLVGSPVSQLQPFELPALAPADALATPPGSAQTGNPNWLAAQERATGARAKVGAIAPELLPKIDMELRQLLSEKTDPLPSSGQQRGWSLNLSYDLPLGGAPFARRREGLARAMAAEGESDRIAQSIELDLNTAIEDLIRSQRTTPLYQRQQAHLESVISASNLQYAAGKRSLLDLINLREAPYGVKQRLADNELQRQSAALRYWSLTGQLLPVLGLSSLLP